MIQYLEVKNFKSLKYLKFDCHKINIFIGKPNTGKSNILESVGIFSASFVYNFADYIRFENMTDFFWEQDINEKITVNSDFMLCEVAYDEGKFKFDGGDKTGQYFYFKLNVDFDGKVDGEVSGLSPIRLYRFTPLSFFPKKEYDFLAPPKGENLFAILLKNKELKKTIRELFAEYGLKISYRVHESKLEAMKEFGTVIYSFPYSLISDTLQRFVFHLIAIETNKNAMIIFEEPEAHGFPYYARFLAERITEDQTNQYFISSHNPYFLLSILEKAPLEQVGIFITYQKENQTMVKELSGDEKKKVIELDSKVFFHLDEFLE